MVGISVEVRSVNAPILKGDAAKIVSFWLEGAPKRFGIVVKGRAELLSSFGQEVVFLVLKR